MIKKSRKKVSVIIPVYNVEKYLEKCLNSLILQTLSDIEIVIVNDGSTDDSQKIIDKFAEKYPDKIKAYEKENGGAAEARNFALSKATGEYIGFVDSDDYVAVDMYEKLYNAAIRDNADIVTCAYYRENEDRCIEKETSINWEYGHSVFEKPNLFVDSVPYIWNKIFKREIIEKNNIRFPNLKIYEDLVFTYQLFIDANKISKVFEPLYFYTVTRQTSLTYMFTEKRFDIFKAFSILIDYMKKKECFEKFRQELLFILLKHIYVVLEKDSTKETENLKKRYINEVFKFLNENFEDWKDNFYFERNKKNKKNYTSKLYWKLRIIINKQKRKKIKRVLSLANKTTNLLDDNRFLGNKFIKYTKLPINEKAILLNSQQGDNINGNMFYLLKELQTNNKYDEYKVYVAYQKEKKEEFKEKLDNYNFRRLELIQINTKKYAKVLATAKYLFNDTSFPTYFIKRKEQIYLNTWHGTPLKTLGKATTNDFHDIANLQKNFAVSDYLLYPSEYMMEHMLEDYMLNNIAKGKVMLCGYPRSEIFFDNVRREQIKKELNINDKKIIAYMPTWRGNVRNVSLEEQLEKIESYLLEIDKSLKEEQVLYVNFHPYVGNNIDFSKFNKIFAFPNKYETYDFLNICDILITDYSSVFFDYALTKNKVILFAYDEKEYLQDRGMYLSLNELPFPKVTNVEQLIKEINSPKTYNDREFLEKYCNYDRKDTSKRICNYIILNEQKNMIIKEIKDNNKENLLIYAGYLNKNKKTDKLISISKNAQNKKYNYYISYITRNIKNNKRQLRELEKNGMNYMGQLGVLNNMSRFQTVLISMIGKMKFLYNIFKNKVDFIYRTELKRIYDDIKFKGVILYGKIGVRKIYEFSNMKGKKIIYLAEKSDFNKKVNRKIYERFDWILTTDEDTFKMVKEYCKSENIKKIDVIEDLNSFNKYL